MRPHFRGVLNAAVVPKMPETQLKVSLPGDLGQALSNGALLCQLANHVWPHSVSVIHVPSPAVVSVFSERVGLAASFAVRLSMSLSAKVDLRKVPTERRKLPRGLPQARPS